jgi:hypothetical protein
MKIVVTGAAGFSYDMTSQAKLVCTETCSRSCI